MFDLTLPIGWEELATIITTIGVVAALVSNRSTSKQLKISLLAQEQSKIVDLFEKRMHVFESVSKNQYVSIALLKLLFNNFMSI